MNRIRKLDLFVSNRIAAGEVVDRPASVVKELVENSIDAGATIIRIDIVNGGLDSIVVKDNGSGIAPEDCEIAFERHATSKIKEASDLDSISTLGFRGEALSSIAAVAQVELNTRVPDGEYGTQIRIEGGKVLENKPWGCDYGTTIRVDNLFFNTPARKKFMRKPARELADVTRYVADLIMAWPDISFEFNSNHRQVYKSPGRGDLLYALFTVYGREVVTNIDKVDMTEDGIRVFGYISYPEAARPNRMSQSFFVNHRCVRSGQLSATVQNAYGTKLMIGRFPLCALHIVVPPDSVDVNIHPSKLEVRFDNNNKILDLVYRAVEERIIERYAVRRPVAVEASSIAKDEIKADDLKETLTKVNVEKGITRKSLFKEFMEQRKPIMPESPKEEKTAVQPAVTAMIDDIALRSMGVPARNEETVTAAKQSTLLSGSWKQEEKLVAKEESKEAEPVKAAETAKEESHVEVPQFNVGLPACRIVGQLFSTYVAAEMNDCVYFIDQHAAHERILYDKLINKEMTVASQQLLTPVYMTLTGIEMAVLKENEEKLKSFGYEYKQANGTRVGLTAVPADMAGADPVVIFRDILETIYVNKNTSDPRRRDLEIASAACKHAIKGNEPLSEKQIGYLLEQLNRTDELNCPHGRPIVVCMTKRDFEKMFRRVL